MKNNHGEANIPLMALEFINGIALLLGPITLPVAVLAKDMEYRWIPFAMTFIYITTLLAKRRLKVDNEQKETYNK